MRRLLEGRLTAFGPWRGSPPKVIMGGTSDEITLLGGGGLVLSQELVAGA